MTKAIISVTTVMLRSNLLSRVAARVGILISVMMPVPPIVA
jgi:hypothetical protein